MLTLCVNFLLLILYMDYIERVTGMKPTKSCLCYRTVTVMMNGNRSIFEGGMVSKTILNVTRSSNNRNLTEY